MKKAEGRTTATRVADLPKVSSDSIPASGTAEEFAAVVGDETLRKVEWAETMGPRLTTDPKPSRSPSFKALHAGIAKLVAVRPPAGARRKKHWKSRHSAVRTRAKK